MCIIHSLAVCFVFLLSILFAYDLYEMIDMAIFAGGQSRKNNPAHLVTYKRREHDEQGDLPHRVISTQLLAFLSDLGAVGFFK